MMDLDEDTHLCLRCGRTIEGLNNYVTHRQQLCQIYNQTPVSPFLSDSSVNLTHIESQNDEPFQYDPHRELYKLSADDFFLNLNLQSTYKTSSLRSDICENNNVYSLGSEKFSTKLDIPPLESNMGCPFSDKSLSPNSIIDEPLSPEAEVPNENFKDQPNLSVISTLDEGRKDVIQVEPLSPISTLKENVSTDSLVNGKPFGRRKKKAVKDYGFTDFATMHVPRTSYRQKLTANGSMMCCQGKQKFFQCLVCKVKYAFASTLLDHLLKCEKKACDTNAWRSEVFNNEMLFVRSSQFRCLVCSFHSGDSFMFLNHLKSRDHQRNSASLKNPLICLPCQDEFCASDEMREHFSKNHLQFKKEDHPIIVAERKKNLHCCFCLTVIKSSSHLESTKDSDALCKEDICFIKGSLPLISSCGFGVDKQNFNSCLTTLSSLAENDIHPQSPVLESDRPTSTEELSDSPEIDAIKSVSKPTNKKVPEYVISKIQSDNKQLPKLSLKRLGDFPLRHPKLIIKKSKKGNFKKIWSCNSCNSQHASKLSLRRHFEECPGQKPEESKLKKENPPSQPKQYLCHICGYIGKNYNQLTRHCRTHTGEKPYQCDYCSYTSSLSSKMVRHKRLHTGLKPYKCPHCDYCCNTQENLRKHILKTKKHEGKMVYPCQQCDYESNEYNEFKEHLSKVHS